MEPISRKTHEERKHKFRQQQGNKKQLITYTLVNAGEKTREGVKAKRRISSNKY